ncbi:hypothetical protein CHS0354_020538 [Potamilus streckersoni]|uniref:BIG2 domain-containing protein n=1 Tax=Potamilus streckersoni TaxID=2493646 RepID=A0AAE0WBY0_9BIVA|nr:hypothetical protein CHS0354_020538 [Potamilus streckersoni]
MAASMCRKMAVTFNIRTTSVVFLISFAWFIEVRAARLSDPKILLPYHSSVITNFTLKINLTREESRVHSCYTWRSSRLDVAILDLINSTDGECAYLARISAVSKSSHRKTSIITAEDKVTGQVLKCIVIVDTISRIEMETTTRLLFLEDSPEELMVRGYDAEGNVFSSLRGLEFEWSLRSDVEGEEGTVTDANSILRILTFSLSNYITPEGIGALEDRGRQGDIILLEGIRTGTAVVQTKLKEKAYLDIPSSSVKLMVIANLVISPSEAYILKYATIKYIVEQIRHNSVIDIKMPSSQFYLEVQDKLICELDSSTSVATAMELGETEIRLRDRNIKPTGMVGLPTAILHVVLPSYLGFVVLPDRKWVLETGREYEVIVEVYDKNSHRLFPSDNVIITAVFPEEFFKVKFSSRNGTYHNVLTLKKGETEIEGVLDKVIRVDELYVFCMLCEDDSGYPISPSIKQTQFVEIFDPIKVQPDRLFLPWDPVSKTAHHYQLQATGGSGDYAWSSDNNLITTVNKRGEITTSHTGTAIITVADQRNSLHKGQAVVHVLPPASIEFMPTKVEAAKGTILELPLAVYAKYKGELFAFADCRKMPLNVTFGESSIFEYVESFLQTSGEGCRTVNVKALHQGHTKVRASYEYEGVILKSVLTIAAYEPLQPIDPEKEALVTVGASKEVIFYGGPEPWVLDSSKYFEIMTSESSSNVAIQPVSSTRSKPGYHNFFVTCKNVGEQQLILKVGNEKTAKNPFPAVEVVSVSFVCDVPVELYITPEVEYPENLPPCPIRVDGNQPVPVDCDQDLNLVVAVTDAHGRRFDNFSSLEFDWVLSDKSLGSLQESANLLDDVVLSPSGKKKVITYRTFSPVGVIGNQRVTVSVSRYRRNYLKMANAVIDEKIFPAITKFVELKLVEEAVVDPNSLSVFNHASNRVLMSIHKGSGYFHVEGERSGVVDLQYLEKKQQIQVIPIMDGSQMITVYDLCIATRTPPTAAIYVTGVGTIQLFIIDKVEVGKDVIAKVQVLDVNGHRLYASFFPLMDLKLYAASKIVSIRPDFNNNPDEYTAAFMIHGSSIGHTSLKAVTEPAVGRTIASQPRPFEVFPPLQLMPRNITLIIGAQFQVQHKGGPSPQCTVVYEIHNSKISTVSSSGLLDAQSLGSTSVVGQAVGQDQETGEMVVYSQDEVTVNVVRLTGIRIHAPLTQIQTGTTMPLFAVGLTEHETPFTFANANPPLNFKWTVNKKAVAYLQSVFHESGISPHQDGNFAMQMVAMDSGHVSVKLEVSTRGDFSQVINNEVLTDELQVKVFKKFAMISPQVCDGHILMTTNTQASLKTNRDGAAKLIFEVISSDNTPAIVHVIESVLETGATAGQAALRITAQEEFGTNQTIVLLIKVKPVSYMMINSRTPLRTSDGQLSAVPRGATLFFSITYHDDVGEQFYATSIQMKYQCSRYDLIQISHGTENNTLIVKTSHIGQTILKVWDQHNPWLMDFINIPVDNVIEPANLKLMLGDIVCFQSPIVSEEGYRGHWSSSKGLSIQQESGIATVTATGTAVVKYYVNEKISTETEIKVNSLTEVNVDNNLEYLTNGPSAARGYNVPIYLGGDIPIVGNNCSAVVMEKSYEPSEIPFKCYLSMTANIQDISVSDLFMVQAVFMPRQGKYACNIQALNGKHDQQLSVLESVLGLYVKVKAKVGQTELVSVPHNMKFLPSMYIHNAEVHLSTVSTVSTIRISTIPDLFQHIQVIVSDSIILEAQAPEKDAQVKSVVLYPIRLIDSLTLWDRDQLDVSVEVICQKIGQKVKIPVYIKLIGQRPEGFVYSRGEVGWRTLLSNIFNFYQYWFLLIVIIVITALTILFGYHKVYGPQYTMAANNSGFMSPAGAAPIPYASGTTPPPFIAYSPYSSYSPQSPKTPVLWSTRNYSPTDGNSPTRRRSPIHRISPS